MKLGGILNQLTVAYETYGKLSPDKDNVVYVCHPLTGDAHAAGKHDISDRKPGWWDDMIGPGKGIDTNYYHVICSNILGGCKGTTGPSSINPTTGKPYGSDFPDITITDIVNVQKLLLEHLGITEIRAVIGGSLGGMQALEWAISHPDIPERCICIAASASLSAQALAFDIVARDAITSDPDWAEGDYYKTGKRPDWGLGHARKIGHITYLSPEIMQKKFGREKRHDAGNEEHFRFQVESYLSYQAKRLVERFDANSYLRISDAMDSYDIAEEHGSIEKAFADSKSKFLIIALSSDWLFPPVQSVELAASLLKAKKEVSYCELNAPHGHDAFLIDIQYLADVVRAFLPWVKTSNGEKPDQTKETSIEQTMIQRVIEPGSSVLDLGCGEGDLLQLLSANLSTSGLGIDIDLDHVKEVIEKGYDVFHADLDRGLHMIPDKSFDYAVLGSTLQVVQKPRLALKEMLRVAREGIVTFPNFAYWQNRLHLGLTGKMPEAKNLSHKWFENTNIHLTTLRDFVDFCRAENISIIEIKQIPSGLFDSTLFSLGLRNLGSRHVFARLI
ncbi:MAG: homoserine O-acetyltransferase, partial [Lentisphaerae bacterium]|nr:homoserine O-acetyltransferase [Lentisphaerota bacterium]